MVKPSKDNAFPWGMSLESVAGVSVSYNKLPNHSRGVTIMKKWMNNRSIDCYCRSRKEIKDKDMGWSGYVYMLGSWKRPAVGGHSNVLYEYLIEALLRHEWGLTETLQASQESPRRVKKASKSRRELRPYGGFRKQKHIPFLVYFLNQFWSILWTILWLELRLLGGLTFFPQIRIA